MTANELLALWKERHLDGYERHGTVTDYARVVVLNRLGIRSGMSFGRPLIPPTNGEADRKARATIRDQVDAIVIEQGGEDPKAAEALRNIGPTQRLVLSYLSIGSGTPREIAKRLSLRPRPPSQDAVRSSLKLMAERGFATFVPEGKGSTVTKRYTITEDGQKIVELLEARLSKS